MCLSQEFFAQRQKTLQGCQKQGFQELEEFMVQNAISETQLLQAGLLEMKEIISTAELVDYRVSDKGKAYFKELKRVQLVLVNEKNKKRLLEQPEMRSMF